MLRVKRDMSVSYLIILIASIFFPFLSVMIFHSLYLSLRQQLLDKCSENESLISRPSVTVQGNSLGKKVSASKHPP